MNKVKKYRSINLFFVKDSNNLFINGNISFPNILCVTSTKKEAEEYINKRLYIENYKHYCSWCELKGFIQDNYSWNYYKKTVINNNYFYTKSKVNYNTLSGLLRIFYGCTPLGCSFDTLAEQTATIFRNSEELEDMIENYLNPTNKNNQA